MNEGSIPAPCCDLDELAGSDFFRALSDPNRLTILGDIASCCGDTKTVSDVARCVPVDLSVVSRHLAVLRRAGIVSAQRRGKEVHYACCYGDVVRILRQVADALEACCPPGIDCPIAD